jgi:hypothetical protein
VHREPVVCRDAQCVNNPPYVEGYLSPLSNPSQLGGGVLYALAFRVDGPARVTAVGFQVRALQFGFGTRGIMGVYGSNGSMPGNLLATTAEFSVNTSRTESVFPGAVVLPQAGTYWVAATFNGAFDTWDDTGDPGSSAFYSTPYAPLPMSFPNSSFSSTVLRNFYVRLQNTQ